MLAFQVITDNAANCVLARTTVQELYPHITVTPCTAHCLDLLLEDIGNLPWVAPAVKQAKDVVKYVTNHQQVLALYRCARQF